MTAENKALEKLKAQQKKLQTRIQKMQAKEKDALRKKELRRKIIVGEFILQNARRDNTLDQLVAQLEPTLTRKGDRALFELDEIPNNDTELSDEI